MAMSNPSGRANYEPNSWGEDGGPRENPAAGYRSFPAPVEGNKGRVRSETFADHYSQARQFYRSQTEVEQKHIAEALTFELSKVQRADIRERVVGHLLNIDETLAEGVAAMIGMDAVPEAIEPARSPIRDLPVSDALSIVRNGPESFRGRKLGVYLADGSDASLVDALLGAAEAEAASCEIVAPTIRGVTLSDGRTLAAGQKIDGGPSVLYDAVAVVWSDEAATRLCDDKPSQDFVSDAFAHAKFIAYTAPVQAIFDTVGIGSKIDEGCVRLDSASAADEFIGLCRQLRFWNRQPVSAA